MKVKNGSELLEERFSTHKKFKNNDELIKDTFGQLDTPTDRYNLIFFVVLLSGVSATIPFNATVTALDYFDDKFGKYNPEFVLPLLVQGPIFIS